MIQTKTMNVAKLDPKSLDIKQQKIQALKREFPEIFTEETINFEKLKQVLGEAVNQEAERYHLSWAGKSNCFLEIQTPTTDTLRPAPEESVNFDTSKNLFIEGDNLKVLKILQKAYYNKVKMIYIDPPYNTGNDFIYFDKFKETQEEYLQASGEKDEEGNVRRAFRKNSKESGHYHSNWLNMMYPRLFLARNLLREDGIIFVSIDDNEVHNLRMIMNEIFGEENFVAQIVWERAFSPKNDSKYFSENHDYILVYTKNVELFTLNKLKRTDEANARYSNPDDDFRGPWVSGDLTVKTYSAKYDYPITTPGGRIVNPAHGSCWRVSKEKFEELLKDNRIWFGEDGNNVPRLKRFLSEVNDGMVPTTLWKHQDVGHNQEGRQEMKDLFDDKGYFDGPKPVRLLKRILQLSTSEDDVVFDFFAGSGTTAQAVMELNQEDGGNRKFILVQLPEEVAQDSEAFRAGYKNIADISKERIRRVTQKIQNPDLGFKVFKLTQSNFKIWRGDNIKDEETLLSRLKEHVDNIQPGAEKHHMLYELLLKQGIEITAEIEGKGEYYKIGELIVCLAEPMTQEIVTKIIEEKPEAALFLDRAFHGNDQLKTNTALQLRDNKIEFKVI